MRIKKLAIGLHPQYDDKYYTDHFWSMPRVEWVPAERMLPNHAEVFPLGCWMVHSRNGGIWIAFPPEDEGLMLRFLRALTWDYTAAWAAVRTVTPETRRPYVAAKPPARRALRNTKRDKSSGAMDITLESLGL